MKVLLADDEPMSQCRLQSLLAAWGYQTEVVVDGHKAWEALQNPDVPPLVILDWMMPGIDGVEICRRLRRSPRNGYVYIILLTGKNSREDLVKGLEAGADDYIRKPFDGAELRARLNAGRRIVTLQAKLLAAQEELQQRATHDGLTGLWNRSAIMEILRMEISRSKRESKPGALVLLDVDHFKSINDTYGHFAGDAVLCNTAQRMRSALRAYDSVGRFGGEEFLMILPGCNESDALALASRVRMAVAESLALPERTIAVSASLGVACWTRAAAFDSNSLLHAADAALYRAKNAGRNRVELATVMELTTDPAVQRESNCSSVLLDATL
jgi:diguanylate cyclase (GGDEF)-like protein